MLMTRDEGGRYQQADRLVPYLEQLQCRAARLSLDFEEVMRRGHVSSVTRWRWRNGKGGCIESDAVRLWAVMTAMADERAQQPEADCAP